MLTEAHGPHEFVVETELDFAAAGTRLRELLRAEGFGVLTEIDVQSTVHEKLGLDFRPYTILGACNPQLAHRGLTADPSVGVLLPCNVVIEQAEPARTRMRFMEPTAALALSGAGSEVPAVAREASARLHRVGEALGPH
jgi:uncharacterized protein (DUF302 family)